MTVNYLKTPKHITTKTILMLTAAIASLSLPQVSFAQSDQASFEDEVIVTARRKAENILDVPGTVTALTLSLIHI